jgi:clan AA aspartic protease
VIRGSVNADYEAIIALVVRGPFGRTEQINAVLDTGFTGFLTLPASIVSALQLKWRGQAEAILGDGSTHQFDVYSASVDWDGHERPVEVDLANATPLLGMGLIAGFDLRIEAVIGGIVLIEARPSDEHSR